MRFSPRKKLFVLLIAMLIPNILIGLVSLLLTQEVVKKFELAVEEGGKEVVPGAPASGFV